MISMLSFAKVYAEEISILEKIETAPKILIQNPQGTAPLTMSATIIEGAEPQNVQDIIDNAATQKSDILVSSNSIDVLKSTLDKQNTKNKFRKIRVMPFEKIQTAYESTKNSVSEYSNKLFQSNKNDKIGLIIITIMTSTNSLIWIHSDTYGIHQKSAMVLMNLVMAVAFGLDKDFWGKLSKPVETRIINIIEKYGLVLPNHGEKFKTLSSQFIGYFAVAAGCQLMRSSLISIDQLSTAVMQSHFWAQTLGIAAASAFTYFSWTEFANRIDEKTQSQALNIVRRLADIRILLLGHLAASAKLMQPEVYGSTPWIALAVHGAIGIGVLLNADAITNYISTHKAFKNIEKTQMKIEFFMANIFGANLILSERRCAFWFF